LKWKCHICKLILNEDDLVNGLCPKCNSDLGLREMCARDHNHCGHDMSAGVATCPVCGEFCCPECGCHDVFVMSRVTGYLAEVNGFNAGKRAEFNDRQRYTFA